VIRIVGRREEQRGAVMIIFALSMILLVGMLAIAIDLGYGFVQSRRAQNASDFAAFAASQQLNGATTCNGTAATPDMAQMVTLVQDMVSDNAKDVGKGWTATFVNGTGVTLTGPGATFSQTVNNSASSFPPGGACGVVINASPTWKPFFAGVFGVNSLGADGHAKVANVGNGPNFGIISLNQTGPHAILGGGSGQFIVNGNIILDTNVQEQPWTAYFNGYCYDDAIDAKAFGAGSSGSNLSVYGTIDSYGGSVSCPDWNPPGGNVTAPLWPLDWCFGNTTGLAGLNGYATAQPGQPNPTYTPGATNSPPNVNPVCSQPAPDVVNVSYNYIYPSQTPISDPLKGSGAPSNPFSADPTCPGLPLHTDTTTTTVANGATLEPGEYTQPVVIQGSAQFGDCSAFGGTEPHYPGVFLFKAGLWIDPAAGSQVTSGTAGVVIATQAPYAPLLSIGAAADDSSGDVQNVPSGGTGNGGPCLPYPTDASSGTPGGSYETDGTNAPCGTTGEYGVEAYNDQQSGAGVDGCPSSNSCFPQTGNYGTGDNFSLIVGGAGTVNLTGPTYGGYGGSGTPGLVFYQDPNTQANYAFDAEPGDSAAITITGVVYNNSLTQPPPFWNIWDNGIPYYAGGTLQTGFGAGWSSSTGPTPSTGSVTINGTAIVDDFNTDGATTIDIQGAPYTLPGGGSLSLVG